MSIPAISNSSSLQALQQLLASLQAGPANTGAASGQNLQSADPLVADAPPPPPQGSSPSNRFSAQALAFLTSLQGASPSSGSSAASSPLAQLELGLNDLSSALRDISNALNSPDSQAASAGASALTATASPPPLSLTSSILTTALNALGALLGDLQAVGGARHGHRHGGGDIQTGSAAASSLTGSVSASSLTSTPTDASAPA